ncbi:MAG: Era-like GTP-binding protein [Candidatus Marsarchaeota archaeon]|nr:Era-like GTP-binding protein [Candidatus Marsarchaeota archaeon]
MLEGLFKWFTRLFKKKKILSLGFYGSPNAGKSTLANRICEEWTGEPISKVSEVPHETRTVQKKEKVVVKVDGKELIMNILDMPGIATKVDYRDFVDYGLSVEESQQRAREATKGIIEAIKWLEHVDAALVVMDSTQDPYTQVNITILGNLEARNIPVIIVANKIDLKKSNIEKIKEAFPQHSIVSISALKGEGMQQLYKTIASKVK